MRSATSLAFCDVGQILPLRRDVLRDPLPIESARFEGDDAPTTLHLAAMGPSGEVIGCLTYMQSPLPADEHTPPGLVCVHRLRGMAVAQAWQGKGVGALLLREMERAARDRFSAEMFWCNARMGALGFYLRHGWQSISTTFDIPIAGPHQRIIRVLPDAPRGACN